MPPMTVPGRQVVIPARVETDPLATSAFPTYTDALGGTGQQLCGPVSGALAVPILSADLWSIVEPLLPPEPPKPKGGRPRVPDRAAFAGILFVLRSGIPWEMLPAEMGYGSGVTCW